MPKAAIARRDDVLVSTYRNMYVAGEIEAEELDSLVERALRGEVTDREYVELCAEQLLARSRND